VRHGVSIWFPILRHYSPTEQIFHIRSIDNSWQESLDGSWRPSKIEIVT